MTAATVTSKGQITIPSSVRTAMHLDVGDRVDFVQIAPDEFKIKAAKVNLMDLKGCLSRFALDRTVTVEEMNEAVGMHVASDMARINAQSKTARRGVAK
jgi:antitoxin PrlF